MMDRRERVTAALKRDFEGFLEDLGDVMQLYYSGMVHWAAAKEMIEVSHRRMRELGTLRMKSLAVRETVDAWTDPGT